jgi:hypothetical protein
MPQTIACPAAQAVPRIETVVHHGRVAAAMPWKNAAGARMPGEAKR